MAPLALLRKAIYDAAAISYKKTINMANLRPIANINVQFDPFHERSTSAREFLYIMSIPKVKYTNINCIVTHKVKCDRSEPSVEVTLLDQHQIVFKAANLTVMEMVSFMTVLAEERIQLE